MKTLPEITARKQQLIADSDAGRYEIARVYYQYQARTMAARQIAGFLRNPVVLAAIGLVALKMPWRRAYRMGGWAWRCWGVVRMVRRILS